MAESGEPVVTLVSKDMVLPANPTHRHNYFLSCFDILWKDVHYNQRLIFYESTSGLLREGVGVSGPVSGQEGGADHGREVMEKLKSSLAVCLVHYYPWCGRLAYGEPNRRLVVDCNDAGVEFVEAYVDLPISLLSKQGFQMKTFYEKLCQQVDHTGDCLYSSPLLSIKATLFSDGGLALGITQSHVVADGQAIWNFMVSWGECARGVPLSAPPELNRELLAVPDPSPQKANWHFISKMEEDDIEEEEEKQTVDHNSTQNHGDGIGTASLLPEEQARSDASLDVGTASLSAELSKDIDPSASVGTDPSATQASSAPLVPCVLTLPSSAVKQLKIASGGSHTSYEVMCAHFWQRLTVARQRPFSEPTSMFVLANCRSRVKPPVPPTYFGNAISFTASATKVGKICSESLNATANRIHNAVLDILQDSLVSFMHWIEIHDHDLVEAITPKLPKGKTINVASSPRFPVYEVDFGWGKPGAVRSGRVPQEGEMVFFGGNPRSPPGDVEICMALPGDVLRRLLEDPIFLAKTPCSPFDT